MPKRSWSEAKSIPQAVWLLLFMLLCQGLVLSQQKRAAGTAANLRGANNATIAFEVDKAGRLGTQVSARGKGFGLFLKSSEVRLLLASRQQTRPGQGREADLPFAVQKDRQHELRWELVGGNPLARASGGGLLPQRSNYLLGSDPRHWRTNIPNYRVVRFTGVYKGIDVLYHGNRSGLQYDFLVAPQADPRQLRLRYEGAERLEIDGGGNLVITLGGQPLIQRRPFVYQSINGLGRPVSGRYVLQGNDQVGIELGAYDAQYPLVIDPTLVYSTYLGGLNADVGTSIAATLEGRAIVTGVTTSGNFPVVGGVSPNLRGGSDVFITKFNPNGTAVEFSTYLGGDGNEEASGLALDRAGNIYLTGTTDSANFPTTAGSFRTQLTGERDAFIAKLNPTGSNLVYSTYLGGSGADDTYGLALDLDNNAYVAGISDSDNLPTTPTAFQPTKGLGSDGFVTKLNANGTALAYSSYLGGNGTDWGMSIATDPVGNIYLAGLTASNNFPTTTGVMQTSLGGSSDVFVAKFNPSLSSNNSLVYSTYLGGGNSDWAFGISVDPVGDAYVTGLTNSVNFPTTNGVLQSAKRGSSDAFVTKLDGAGQSLIFSTYLGGDGADSALSIALDSAGEAFITGSTQSSNFPTTSAAFQPNLGGRTDSFVVKLNYLGTGLLNATYLGGAEDDDALAVAQSNASRMYATGNTVSVNFPTTTPFQPANGGNGDAFVTKLADSAPTTAIEEARFFARQHYVDFLNRDPDPAGWDFWTGQITLCGSEPNCIRQRRIAVSNAFFFELEFQQTGAYVYRLYRGAYGNTQPFPNPAGDDNGNPYCQQTGCTFRAAHIPSYTRFVTDRALVVGSQNLAASQLALANLFVGRPEFIQRYPLTLSGAQYVDALLARIQTDTGANLTSQRDALIALHNNTGRGAVMYRLADDNLMTNPINNRAFIDAEYNRGFVLTQYFGYLRRDPDMPGLNFWRDVVSQFPLRSPVGQNGMVCAFITSQEYQERFSALAPRNNGECS